MSVRVSQLIHYPVKSCQGIALTHADIDAAGICHDRRWMVVDERGRYVGPVGGAKPCRSLCRIVTAIDGARLGLQAPDMPDLVLPVVGERGLTVKVTIRTVPQMAVDQGDDAAGWFREYLSRTVPGRYRLVRLSDQPSPEPPPAHLPKGFFDASPILILGEAALDDLNARLAEPVAMARFRPNIVLSGCTPFAEDRATRLRIGPVDFVRAAGCVRCPVVCIDPVTGERGAEPMQTLTLYRRSGKRVLFGSYYVAEDAGRITLGDAVEIEEAPL